MTEPMPVATEIYTSIPEDATPEEKLYMRAQVVLQGAFYSLGDREAVPGEATLVNRRPIGTPYRRRTGALTQF